MVASVAEVRQLVVVMRSVKQTYCADRTSPSGYWTVLDIHRGRRPSGDQGGQGVGRRAHPAAVANATVPGGGHGGCRGP